MQGYAPRDGNIIANFFYCQPALNYGFENPDPARPWQLPTDHPDVRALREEIKRIIQFWLDLGADGFRADIALGVVRAGVLAPGGFHVDMLINIGPGGRAYTSLFRHEAGRSINEKWVGHSFFDPAGKGNIRDLLDPYLRALRESRGRGYIALPSGNHDSPRLSLGRDPEQMKMALAFLLTLPGLPILYYGDEIGMRHQGELPSKEGGYNLTGARTPMQWTSGPGMGFSAAEGERFYLPVDPLPGAPCVEAQVGRPDSLLETVRRLVALRRGSPALQADGELAVLHAETGRYPLVYACLVQPATGLLCAFNPAAREEAALFPWPEAFKGQPALLEGVQGMPSLQGQAAGGLCRLVMPPQS